MQSLKQLFRLTSPNNVINRMYNKHNKKYLYKDGVQFDNINYYPRNDFVETTIEPAKLFRVHRVKPSKGNPHWEKRILRELGLLQGYGVAIVKNIPENNARLWKIKHLIKIVPITFPHGELTEQDINYSHLKENGECIVIKDIKNFNNRMDANTQFIEEKKKQLSVDDLKKDSRLKWLNNW